MSCDKMYLEKDHHKIQSPNPIIIKSKSKIMFNETISPHTSSAHVTNRKHQEIETKDIKETWQAHLQIESWTQGIFLEFIMSTYYLLKHTFSSMCVYTNHQEGLPKHGFSFRRLGARLSAVISRKCPVNVLITGHKDSWCPDSNSVNKVPEFVLVFTFYLILLFFYCKCVVA